MALDLSDKHKNELLSLLRRFAPEHDILAFGSRTHGTSHEGSDLDITLRHRTSPQTRVTDMAALREALIESNIPFIIDIHDWALLPPSFQAEIEAHHVCL